MVSNPKRQAELGQKADRRQQPKRGQRRATSYDVARVAGVSQSAVSRVFKAGASASAEMRERVQAAAKQVGYRPNAIARGLITQRSDMVAVVISRMTNLYYPELLVQLTKEFSRHGIRVLLFTLEHEREIDVVLEQMLQYQVDGIVTAAMLTSEQLALIDEAGIPVALYNRRSQDGLASAVRCDQEEGERWLVSQLVEAGHRRFAIISGPEDSTVSVERTSSAMRKLAELGVADVTVVVGDYSYESGRSGFAALMEQLNEPPDAVVAANDVMAIGCIDAARREFDLPVPDVLSVVGFDGVGPSRYAAYDLTTVQQPVERMTRATVAILRERIENPQMPPEERVFTGVKIAGGSARLST